MDVDGFIRVVKAKFSQQVKTDVAEVRKETNKG